MTVLALNNFASSKETISKRLELAKQVILDQSKDDNSLINVSRVKTDSDYGSNYSIEALIIYDPKIKIDGNDVRIGLDLATYAGTESAEQFCKNFNLEYVTLSPLTNNFGRNPIRPNEVVRFNSKLQTWEKDKDLGIAVSYVVCSLEVSEQKRLGGY
jgi:hypothetical protein